MYVPCGPTISWTGGDIGGDGTETNKSYFNNHFVWMKVVLLFVQDVVLSDEDGSRKSIVR